MLIVSVLLSFYAIRRYQVIESIETGLDFSAPASTLARYGQVQGILFVPCKIRLIVKNAALIFLCSSSPPKFGAFGF
jgi:hypothetical protein